MKPTWQHPLYLARCQGSFLEHGEYTLWRMQISRTELPNETNFAVERTLFLFFFSLSQKPRTSVKLSLCWVCTHVFVGGQVRGYEVCMEAWKAQNRPNWEETYDEFDSSESWVKENKTVDVKKV